MPEGGSEQSGGLEAKSTAARRVLRSPPGRYPIPQSLQRTYPFPRSNIFKKLMKMNSLRNTLESKYT